MYSSQTKRPIFKIICIGLSFVFIFAHILLPKEAWAGRSKAGGGDLAEFDFSKVAISAGMSLGSMALGSVFNTGLSSFFADTSTSALNPNLVPLTTGGFVDGAVPVYYDLATGGSVINTSLMSASEISASVATPVVTPSFFSAMGDSLAKSFTFDKMATNYGTFVATSQVGRAVGMMGNYYGWSPSSTFIVSNATSSLTGGFLNPSVALAAASDSTLFTMARGAVVGGLTGLASGGITVAIDGDRIDNRQQPGAVAQIAGMTTGVAVGNFSRALVDPATYTGVDNLKIGGRLLEATFIKTADMWPRLAARSLSIIAANSVDKDNKLFSPSMVSSLAEGTAAPFLTGVAHYFALQPGLSMGEDSAKNNIVYADQMKKEIGNQYIDRQREADKGPDKEVLAKIAQKDTTVDQALEAAGTGRLSLFWHNTSFKEMAYGLTEGAIQGGVSNLTSKLAKHDPLAAAAAGYGATLFTGAIRGVVQNWMYDPKVMQDLIEDKTVGEARKQELKEYQAARDKGPGTAVLMSLAKANRDFLERSFAFGAPQIKPEKIDALMATDYFNKLNSYALAGRSADWFERGLTSGLTNAGSFATSTDILTTLGATPLGAYLNIAPYTYDAQSAGKRETYRKE